MLASDGAEILKAEDGPDASRERPELPSCCKPVAFELVGTGNFALDSSFVRKFACDGPGILKAEDGLDVSRERPKLSFC